MATDFSSTCSAADEDDYIHMELSSPQNNRDFEFQMMSSICNGRESTASPADELFYKGKLLPLYLPPRMEMVRALLRSSNNPVFEPTKQVLEDGDEHCAIAISTHLESCNISPSDSCRVSCELNPSEYFFEWSTTSTELSGLIYAHPKNSWSKKLKMIKQSSLSQKLKASRAYLRSLFTKSPCTDEPSCAKAAEKEPIPSKYISLRSKKKSPFGHLSRGPYPTIASLIKNIDKEGMEDSHRRSFSGALKRHSPSKCLSSSSSSSSGASSSSSSSSFSINSNSLYESHSSLKRSSSDASDLEISIQSAIAHCKNSNTTQLAFNSRSPLSEAGYFSLSIS